MLIVISHKIRREVYFFHSIALKTTHFPKVGNVENEGLLDQGETETQHGETSNPTSSSQKHRP